MKQQKLSLIVAMANNGVIGRDNDLPWRIPADLKRFRAITMGHHIVMGRKTYQSLNRLLPGRTTVIISRNSKYNIDGAINVTSIDEAIAACGDEQEIFFIGGAEIFRDVLHRVDRIYLTLVEATIEGDAHFPKFDRSAWTSTSTQSVPADALNEYPHQFLVLDRIQAT